MKILIAEDDPITSKRLQHFLKKWGHIALPAKNGLEALEKFISADVDMVITDWMMPEMDGPELVRHLRSRGKDKPYVYVMLLTSKKDKIDIVKGLEQGVDDYIVKPFDPDELRARINTGERTIRLERTLRDYGEGLEKIVKMQTNIIRKTQEETIFRLLTALESRDEETAGHVNRIALFSVELAKAAGWQDNMLADLKLAAPMHDIGKIGVPDTILLKKGPLTVQEFEIIKAHTTIGGQILEKSKFPMIQMACDIAVNHHEKFDGTGYPEGITGAACPEAARIVAIVDVYDALSNERIYKKASSEDEALNTMHKGCGSHFDPFLFDLFIELIPEFRKIIKENP